LELQRYFGIYDILSEKTARAIWEKSSKLLNSGELRVRNLIKKSNVRVICTTDDPADSLEYHFKLKKEKDFDVKVLPAMRPDKGLEICKEGFKSWIRKLGSAAGRNIGSYDDFLAALEDRIAFFHSAGCRVSDHGIDNVFYEEANFEDVSSIFRNALEGWPISKTEEMKYKTYTLKFLGRKYAELNWTMQLHMNAVRNTNSKMYKILGPDTGYDSVNDGEIAAPLVKFMNSLEAENSFPKMILYTLNPKDNHVIAALLANYGGSGVPGKLQFGSAWWFNDNIDGMTAQIKSLANAGLLSRFVGMLTDSRSSFLHWPA
jgi:glucuronate isomerase